MQIYFLNWLASYEKSMIDYLSYEYAVKRIVIPKKLQRLCNKFSFVSGVPSLLAMRYIKKELSFINEEDIIIVNDSNILNLLNHHIIKHLSCRKVLLLRNPVSINFVNRVRNLFDEIFTFEKDKALMLGVNYLSQFIPIGYNDIETYQSITSTKNTTTCFFLGRDKARFSLLSELANNLENIGCKVDFSIVRDKTSHGESKLYIESELDYSAVFLKTILSDVVIDIVQQGQTGWTLRILEAIFLNKKIITNNKQIIKSEFYSPERIFILGERDWGEITEFLSYDLSPIANERLYHYTPDNMIEFILDKVVTEKDRSHLAKNTNT